MRYTLSLAVLGFVLGAGVPAFAQQQQQQPSYVYQGQQQDTAPIYNNLGAYRDNMANSQYYNSGANLRMLPMQQMIAGQNAPSYAFGNRQQQQQNGIYNNGGGFLDGSVMGGISPEQANAIRAQRNANAAAYQQQYLENARQRQQMEYAQQQNMAGSQYQGAQFNQLYAENAEPKPVKKKVIYNQLNNPLVEPPRLFNPDR